MTSNNSNEFSKDYQFGSSKDITNSLKLKLIDFLTIKNILWVIGLFLVLILLPYILLVGVNGVSNAPDNWAQFGDYVGGTLGTLVGLVGTFLIFFTFRQQQQALFQQQKNLDLIQMAGVKEVINELIELGEDKISKIKDVQNTFNIFLNAELLNEYDLSTKISHINSILVSSKANILNQSFVAYINAVEIVSNLDNDNKIKYLSIVKLSDFYGNVPNYREYFKKLIHFCIEGHKLDVIKNEHSLINYTGADFWESKKKKYEGYLERLNKMESFIQSSNPVN